ncbi:MAG TPA: CBS domain-containing protein [Stellaceae bacterium]|nr:CBS domain-containing protein [Stellaceae bacterium]
MLDTKGWGVVVVTKRQPVTSVAQFLTANKIGAAPVVDEDGLVVGMLSERDITRAVGQYGEDAVCKVAEELMTKLVATCTPEDNIIDIMQLMTSKRCRHIPVMNGERLLGIVSIGDVVKARLEEAQFEVDALRSYITSP